MKTLGKIAIVATVGLLLVVAVSVIGGGEEKATTTRTVSREGDGEVHSGAQHLVNSPFETKEGGVPGQVNYQGYLVNSSDNSAVTGTLEVILQIFDDPIYGYPLWDETHDSVVVIDGLFNVILGSATPFPGDLFTGLDLWLQTKIEGESLWPRKKLVSVPYAFKDNCWTPTGDDCYFDKSGNVGIGTASPGAKLDVDGNIKGSQLCIGGDCRSSWPTATKVRTGETSVIVTGHTSECTPWFNPGIGTLDQVSAQDRGGGHQTQYCNRIVYAERSGSQMRVCVQQISCSETYTYHVSWVAINY